jgi:hypothetical protein
MSFAPFTTQQHDRRGSLVITKIGSIVYMAGISLLPPSDPRRKESYTNIPRISNYAQWLETVWAVLYDKNSIQCEMLMLTPGATRELLQTVLKFKYPQGNWTIPFKPALRSAEVRNTDVDEATIAAKNQATRNDVLLEYGTSYADTDMISKWYQTYFVPTVTGPKAIPWSLYDVNQLLNMLAMV